MTQSLPEVMNSASYDSAKDGETLSPKINYRNSVIAVLVSMMYIFAMGMTISYTAPATVDMKRPGSRLQNITPNDITWIGSLTLLGGVPANILGGYLTHRYGRKAVLMMFSPLFLIAWLMIAYASTVEWLCAGRCISGFCTGLFVVAGPAYITEIAPIKIRGLLSSVFALFTNLGILVVIGLGIFFRWSWLAIIVAIVITVATCLMYFMPESPAWLVRESRIWEAARALKFFRGKHFDVKKEIQDILISLAQQENKGISFRDLKNPILYKPLIISCLFMLFHNTSGSAAIVSYTVEIFKDAGSTIEPNIAATILAGMQIVAGIACGSVVDKCGRKSLYIISGIITCLTLVSLGVYSLVLQNVSVHQNVVGYVPLICLSIFAFAFTLGLGSIPFVMIPEMVPLRFRSAVLSLTFLIASACGFTVTKSFHNLREIFGYAGIYFTYASFTFLSVLFGYFMLPETKNLTVDEISKLFLKSKY